jgi:hypothetical protein
MFWQADFFRPFRQTKLFRLMELSHLILKYEEKSVVSTNLLGKYLLQLTSGNVFFFSSFCTENLQLDEGYFPAHAWHDNFFINFHYLQFLLIFVLPWDQWVPWQHLDGS